jgi:Glucose-6-phosphate dehydrogenase subunit
MAPSLEPLIESWNGVDTSIAEIEGELVRLRAVSALDEDAAVMRTSVMTHCAWVPPEWLDAAEAVLEGLAERHPSRTLLLVPRPGEPDGLDADVSVRCFEAGQRQVCGEVIELQLRGNRSRAPASLVLPLIISDLPVYCRWRGRPGFGDPPWEQMVDVVDRLIVDSAEWGDATYAELLPVFERTAVSDLVWARLRAWRVELAACWPEIAEQEIHLRGPLREASLLHGWLSSRLQRSLLAVEPADEVGVRLGGEELVPPELDDRSPSDLLSGELDRLTRDPIYEQAARAAFGDDAA